MSSYDTCRFKYKPITVEYDLTNFGRTPEPFIDTIAQWGIDYRETLFGKKEF
ncbi:winged helix-turn-helix transcriptional regulator [Chryseobacterium carnipullorum]|uniref:winged helix-turn-helix transcriptional regulator n=1 Tax=Chryseobacterium carnipullorum TaxID=1124835 RepID=UPI001E4CC1BA|nr:winged helix-turn-helix transcriptional regulator [Chryseobacterium carnipullorum]